MTTVTTHVLDATRGRPASGLTVRLGAITALTGQDGRAALGEVGPGVHEVIFAVGEWFAAHATESFYPRVAVTFRVTADEAHCHVPLLLSPYGYSTYRGS